MANSLLKSIGDGLADFIDSVREQLEDDLIRRAIAEDLGLQPGASVPQADLPQANLDGVARYRSQANPDKEAFIVLLGDVRAIYIACRQFIGAFGAGPVTVHNELLYRMFDLMAANYMRIKYPREYFLIQAVATLVDASAELVEEEAAFARVWKTLAKVVSFGLSPLYYLFKALGAEDEAAARRVSEGLFPQIAAALALGGVTDEIIYGWDTLPDPAQPLADAIAERALTVAFPLDADTPAGSDLAGALALTLGVIPASHGGPSGLLVSVGGSGEFEVALSSRWKFLLAASAQPSFSVFLDTKLGNITGHGPTNAPLNVALVSVPDQGNVTYAIPDADGTRVEIGQLALAFGFDGTRGQIRAQALRCALVIATKDQDGFLARLLPADGLRVPFDFGVGFSSERRFFTEGGIQWPTGAGGGLPAPAQPLGGAPDADAGAIVLGAGAAPEIPVLAGSSKPELGVQQLIPIGRALLAVRLNHLLLALAPASDPASARATAEVSLSLALKLGPVTAAVERIGVELGVAFPEDGGNAGFADLGLGLKAPSGVGIKVDSPFVSGGGFLFFDAAKGQYAGFVQLTIQELLTVSAIGVITTRLPGGARGFSFVVMITAEDFRPIALGLGFSLTGIGGLLAINRTVNEEFLREGIKSRTLDDLLFPKDPIRNAAQIFATLNNAFPPRDGSYLFGPVVQISWGTPPVLTMDLGLVLELGNRRRLVILGRVRAIMPSERNDLLRLQMNALGVIDFDQRSIALDAVLYDSRLAGRFPITGAMAMRLRWGRDPLFALSIGGFHPAFKPPPGIPVLERLAISFSNTESFRLRAESYFALTSNTLQFGAKAHLFASAGGFSVEGGLGYDVLIQFDPFAFLADFYASLQLRRGSRNLFKVKLEGQLAGPRPLRVRAKATFEILWCDFSISIDRTLVAGEPPPQPEPVLVMQKLRAALEDPRSWTGQGGAGDRRVAVLREAAAGGQLVLDPLGGLTVRQSVVPLELEIARFGGSVPADGRVFRITALTVNGATVAFERVSDFFAPAQFLELSDDERLAAPSFEAMPAGIRAGGGGGVRFTADEGDILEEPELTYETRIIDRAAGARHDAEPMTLSPAAMGRQLALGAAARSELRHTGVARYRPAGGKNSLVGRGWTVASALDGAPQPAPELEAGAVVSYAEAFLALQKLREQQPARAGALMLLRVPKQPDEQEG